MSLIVNGTEVDKVVYNGTEVEKVVYNGTVVWENSDELILNVSSKQSYNNNLGLIYGIFVYVTAGKKGCSVSFNNQTKVVAANTSENVIFETETEGVTGDLIIKGDFTNVYPSNIGDSGGVAGYKINEIKKWYNKLNYVPNYFFQYMTIDFNIELPDNIVEIEENAFQQNTAANINISSNNILTFNNLESCLTFYPRDTFFSNATNNGDVWSINGFVLAPYGANSMGRTDTFTIPNGTKHLAAGLFYAYPSTGATKFNLSNINFSTDGLLTDIPDSFCVDAVNLNNLEIPASIVKIGARAFAQSNQEMTLTEITFNQSENTEIEFAEQKSVGLTGAGAFYTKSNLSTNVYTENISVLNYNWNGDNRTVTFYKLDKTTIIPRLTTPTISMNGNVLNVDDYDINSAKFVISAFGNIIETTQTSIDLTPYIPTPEATTTYTISIYSLTDNNSYARSLSGSTTYTITIPTEEQV